MHLCAEHGLAIFATLSLLSVQIIFMLTALRVPQINNGTFVQTLVRGEQAEQSDIKVPSHLSCVGGTRRAALMKRMCCTVCVL